MPNFRVFTDQASDLKTRIYRNDGTSDFVIKTDSTGVLAIQDNGTSITVDATNLDIRDLTNASDSILIYGQDGRTNRIVRTDTNRVLAIQDNGGTISIDDNGSSITVDTTPHHSRSFLCEGLSWNHRGQLTIINEFTGLKANSRAEFLVVNLWREMSGGTGEPRSPRTYRESVVVTGPGGEIVARSDNRPFSLPADFARQVNYTRFESLDLSRPGVYCVRVELYSYPGEIPLVALEHELAVA